MSWAQAGCLWSWAGSTSESAEFRGAPPGSALATLASATSALGSGDAVPSVTGGWYAAVSAAPPEEPSSALAMASAGALTAAPEFSAVVNSKSADASCGIASPTGVIFGSGELFAPDEM